MSYRQEIHGQLSIPDIDELMEETERKKRIEIEQPSSEAAALAEGVEMDGPPDPVYTEEEKRRRAKEAWEYNKMTQDLQGEIPPNWYKSESIDEPIPMRGWQPVGGWQADQDAAVEDEALRRLIRDALNDLAFQDTDTDKFHYAVEILILKLPELLGRYEALFSLAEQVAKASPIDRNGVYRSQRPQENIPGTDRMEER